MPSGRPRAFSRRSEEHTSELQSPCNLVCRIIRSEEHTSELQSPCNLVCRLLLEKKKNTKLQSPCNLVSRILLGKKNRRNYSSSQHCRPTHVDMRAIIHSVIITDFCHVIWIYRRC